MESIKIKCPSCGHQFPVEDAIFSQAEERIRKKYEEKTSNEIEIIRKQKEDLEKERADFEKVKEKEKALFDEKLKEKLAEEKVKLDKVTKLEYENKIKTLEQENEERKSENKLLKQKELELLKRENKLKEEKEEIELEIEKQLLEKRDELVNDIRKQEQEKNSLKFKEYEKKLDDQKKLVEEMQRKAEQGSVQMQGEVQELALEDLLKNVYPFDIIDEVPKGVSGADVIQSVVNPLQQICGKIIYESKRTKSFSESWIEKLKEDQRSQKADIAVIITETLPKDFEKFGRKDGVWICSFGEAKALSFVLREMIIKTYSVKASEVNKGDKMSLLYNYLISDDFNIELKQLWTVFLT